MAKNHEDRTSQCERRDNMLGLHAAINGQEWVHRCAKVWSKKEREDEDVFARSCACGIAFDCLAKRDRHIASNQSTLHHGPTVDEMPFFGGAYAIVDTVTGRVLEARAFPLLSLGYSDENSSRGEAASIVQGANAIRR